jgi:hypothetical protein
MLQALSTFAALSIAGTVILSLLAEGGVKRTAALVLSLLTLLYWAEGIATLLGLSFPVQDAASPLAPTSFCVESAAEEAAASLSERWDATP